jgi:arabinan endo-1,5-alpha-L-arabinosidase
MWNKTLDPKSPDFKWSEAVEVCFSDGMEDQDAIDPGIMLDPATGRLWVSYGTYFGTIRLIELDPTTGFRKSGNVEKDIAIDCEASDLICRNGWYYLLGTHGTCCDGVNSTYNIVVGRSKSPEGPYIDNVGRDMYHGGRKMVVAAGDRKTGAGHFGRTIVDEGVEVASFHWEADFDQGGSSVLAIRPLLWKNDWPYCGELFKGGTFEIESERRGYALELAVDFVRMNVARRGGFGGFGRPQQNAEPPKPVANQTLAEVIDKWPKGDIPARIGDYMFRPWQRWTISPVEGKGAYLGNTYFKIVIEGTERALAATADKEVTTVPEYTGADEQLWRIEQLTDGTFRIMPKIIPGQEGINKEFCLYSAGDSTPTLAKYDFNSDNSKWNFRNH